MKATKRRSLALMAGSTSVAALMVTTLGGPATAASSDGYLARTIGLLGPCGQARVSLVGSYAVNPDTWYVLVGSKEVDPGDFITITYRYNGVKHYNKYLECIPSDLMYKEEPTQYVHRYEYVNYVFEGGGIAYIGTTWSAWKAGTIS
jgi:hypothetical protein